FVKKTLAESASGDIIRVLLDNKIACENVLRYLTGNGAKVTTESESPDYCLKAVISDSSACEICVPDSQKAKPPAVAITHSGMGHGSEELGRILIQACINALHSIEPRPSTMVFYNSGVHLACEGSPVLPALEELERLGVKILVCGTCLEYFSLADKRKVGVTSNMFEILTAMSEAGHVITP
ncbi:MAG: sulfurtransferase-like selenium metabolism protein YedF, partial [Candidatus Riflebacteria bacterium]|nr:sulfurtransferase-like selenium metabolism protein YedF [Candidatus Riflebacteria bacterium]